MVVAVRWKRTSMQNRDPTFSIRDLAPRPVWPEEKEPEKYLKLYFQAAAELTVTDSNGGTAEVTVSITITGIVEAPDVSAMSADVHENDMSGPNLLEVSSPDTGVTFSVDNDKFEIDTVGSASVLKLKDGMYLDHEGTDGMVTLMITASDGTTTSAATEVTINVGDVNEAPTVEDGSGSVEAGGATAAMASGNVMAMDVDDGDTHTFVVTTDAMYGTLMVDEMGAWTYTLAEDNDMVLGLNAGAMLMDEAIITVTDADGLTATSMVTITIDGFNDAPTIEFGHSTPPEMTAPTTGSIAENEMGPVAEVVVMDSEDMVGTLKVEVVDDMRFAIEKDNNNKYWLKLVEPGGIDYEMHTSVDVTVMVTDSGGKSDTDTITVTINNVNEPPGIRFEDEFPSINENEEGVVGIFQLVDPEDTPDVGEFDIEDVTVVTPGFKVNEDGEGYKLELTREGGYNYEDLADTMGMVTVTLRIKDSEGLEPDTPITVDVQIIDIPEAPTIEFGHSAPPGMDQETDGSIEENAMGPVARIDIMDDEDSVSADDVKMGMMNDDGSFTIQQGDSGQFTIKASDDRFIIKADEEGGLWLVLNEAVDYDGAMGVKSVDVMVEVTDSSGMSHMATQTVMIVGVDEAPEATGDVKWLDDPDGSGPKQEESKDVPEFLSWTAGTPESYKLDITNAFTDEDGDTLFNYTIENKPSWLNYSVVRSGDNVYLTLSGNPPSSDEADTWTINVFATDQSRMSDDFSLQIIADDGNDAVTDIRLMDKDGANLDFPTVDENDKMGPIIGYVQAVDQDDPNHVNGQHKWQVDIDNRDVFEVVPMDGKFALRVKPGSSVDYESNDGNIQITVTATDINGAGRKNDEVFNIEIVNKNDPVKVLTQPGNWWAIVERGLDPEDVKNDGDWLKFEIENDAGDRRHLFQDGDNGDEITYRLVGNTPSWLMIDKDGVIMSKKGTVPTRGVFEVTVEAMDGGEDGSQPVTATFRLAIALSDDAMDDDNDEPQITNSVGFDIDENPKQGDPVATFTVRDDDYGLDFHPWAPEMPTLTATNGDDGSPLPASYFKIEPVGEPGDESANFKVVLTKAGAAAMNHEEIDDVDLTFSVTDGIIDSPETRVESFNVDDVNEKPHVVAIGTGVDRYVDIGLSGRNITPDGTEWKFTTYQQEDEGDVYIVLKLKDLFDDPDDRDKPEDLTFRIDVSNTPWLTLVHQAAPFEDIEDGPDGDGGTEDDINLEMYGSSNPQDDNDWVAVLKIDRTGMDDPDGDGPLGSKPDSSEIGQDENGSFTIIASDRLGLESSTKVNVKIEDQNLHPRQVESMDMGVSIANKKPAQNTVIRMDFDPTVDPDFTGEDPNEPIVTLYQWSRGEGDPHKVTVDAASPYRTTDADVDSAIKGSVVYFELFNGKIVKSNPGNGPDVAEALSMTTAAVINVNDDASGSITYSTSESSLVATVMANDIDSDNPSQPGEFTYHWLYSDNGSGGWKDLFGEDDPNFGNSVIEVPDDKSGKYIRVAVTFVDGDGNEERIEDRSESVKVGDIDSVADDTVTIYGPTVSDGTATPVGGTLRLEGLPRGASVQWQANGVDISGATDSSYEVAAADASKKITAKFTTYDPKGNVVSISSTGSVTVASGPGESHPIVVMEDNSVDDFGAMNVPLFEESRKLELDGLFEDAENDPMTFVITTAQSSVFRMDDSGGSALKVYRDGNADGFDQLLIIDDASETVHYYTTKKHTHDGDNTDGMGNTIDLSVSVKDGDDDQMATVKLHIDVEETGVNYSNQSGSTDAPAVETPRESHDYLVMGGMITENAKPTGVNKQTGVHENPVGQVVLNIQDENGMKHDYGSYNWEPLPDDSPFEIVSSKMDLSVATLRLKDGMSLDYEAVPDGDPGTSGKQAYVFVMVKATPKEGNFDPIEIMVRYTVEDQNREQGDQNHQPEPQDYGTDVAGLKDDDGDNNDEDDGADDDNDGGKHASDAMSMFASSLDDGLF